MLQPMSTVSQIGLLGVCIRRSTLLQTAWSLGQMQAFSCRVIFSRALTVRFRIFPPITGNSPPSASTKVASSFPGSKRTLQRTSAVSQTSSSEVYSYPFTLLPVSTPPSVIFWFSPGIPCRSCSDISILVLALQHIQKRSLL